MGRKLTLPSHKVLDAQDASTDFVSKPTDTSSIDIITYDISIDGNLNGLLYIQFSNEANEADAVWKDLDFAEPLALDASVETDYHIEIKSKFKRLRLDWDNTSGTGSMTAKVYGVTVGA